MKCEFIEECSHAKRYVGRICLHKAELCKMRLKIIEAKELEEIFSEKGYRKGVVTIRARPFGKPKFITITIDWGGGKITFLSVKEVKEKAWERSTFPSYVKELLDRFHNKFVLGKNSAENTTNNL